MKGPSMRPSYKMFSFISFPKGKATTVQGRESFILFEVLQVMQCITDSITRIE